MAMTAELRVDPQAVINKSSDMKSIRGRLSSIMGDMKGKFQSLGTSWESGAATTFQTQFTKIHKDIEEMLNIVDEYTYDLDEIARIYIEREREITDKASALPPNVFG
jgi:WXG100 family type VII secretion target